MKASVNIEEICNKATDAAIKRYKDKEREERKKSRFRNTELLLRNIRHLRSWQRKCSVVRSQLEDGKMK